MTDYPRSEIHLVWPWVLVVSVLTGVGILGMAEVSGSIHPAFREMILDPRSWTIIQFALWVIAGLSSLILGLVGFVLEVAIFASLALDLRGRARARKLDVVRDIMET